MNEKLRELLVCPVCKEPLFWHEAHQELWCKGNRLAFPVRDDIPVMMTSEARTLTDEELAGC
jgi:uncharacterized protein